MPDIKVETLKLKDREQSTVPYPVVNHIPIGVEADNIRKVAYGLVDGSNFMSWEGVWEVGCYEKNDVVRDGEWAMIANKDTCDRPAPQPVGDLEVDLPATPAWADKSFVGTVQSGSIYTFTKSGWVTAYQVWIPEYTNDTKYKVITVDTTDPDNPLVSSRDIQDLTADTWNLITVGSQSFQVGTKIAIFLEALNSGGTTQVTGGWARDGDSNNKNPATSQWNTDNNGTTLRIDKTDLDATDRATELLSIIAGSDIQFVSTLDSNRSVTYHTETVVDDGSAIIYNVIVSSIGISGQPLVGSVTTMTATIPVAQATKYVDIVDHWVANQPSFATIEGKLSLGGTSQTVPNNAYGVRLSFQEAYISPDWDLIAKS